MKDRDEKGRVAAGARNGSRTKPERLPRGDRHWSRTKPDRVARGDRNGSRTKPDSVLRGETHGRAKLTEDQVRNVLAEYAPGGVTQQALAAKYGVTQITISRIINGQLWGHI
jgi:DNA invertase Pin-like site-specific DNA recombinase